MKCSIALACAAFLAAPAAPNGSRWSSDIPPQRFMGDNVAVVIFASDVAQFCSTTPPAGMVIVACVSEAEGVPVMVLPNPCPKAHVERTARIACHELAHVNHWSGEHER